MPKVGLNVILNPYFVIIVGGRCNLDPDIIRHPGIKPFPKKQVGWFYVCSFPGGFLGPFSFFQGLGLGPAVEVLPFAMNGSPGHPPAVLAFCYGAFSMSTFFSHY